LLLTEVVTNAVKHGTTSATAPILVEGALIGRCLGIEVTNDGGHFEHSPDTPVDPAPDMALGGRGLDLVDAIASRWGAHHDDGRTTVWFELELQ
jgi:anti-sigma regulatory factor (Ser/Thr protein kinase)